MNLPWWAFSPSPMTLTFWVLASLYGWYKLRNREYRRYSQLLRFTDAALILGVVVLFGDLIWVLICILKFGPQYPGEVYQLSLCILRDLMGVIFCLFFSMELIMEKKIDLMGSIPLWGLNILFMVVWFVIAPDPSLTDWTYAWRYGYPWERVLESFLISHVVGKSLSFWIYWRLFE